ncbi:MAG: hypothetical protein HOF87_12075 [Gemmatimonadales bacterium]|nr:hypothetical protein [Gemmatimonadales bacterium]
MKTVLSLLALVGLAACSPGASDSDVDTARYADITRTGYFDEPAGAGSDVVDETDWRSPFITREQAQGDLQALDSLLEHRYAYTDADELDEETVFAVISDALPERIRVGDFAMQLQKALALSIDGHAPRINGERPDGVRERIEDNPPGSHYFPFELRSTGAGRIVAFDAEERGLIDEEHPYVLLIDGQFASDWIYSIQDIIVDGSPQLKWHRGSRHLSNIGFMRMEVGAPASETAEVVFQNEAGSSQLTRTVRLVSESVASADRYPFAEDALARVPSEVAYFRLRRMEGDEPYIDSLATWIQGQRDASGVIIDIRDNGGGSRLPLLTLLPHVLSADASPVVVTAGKLKLPAECLVTACPAPAEGYLANRFMRPLSGFAEGTPERAALDLWLPTFAPEWTPPEEGFSDWHYLVISPDEDPVFARTPVIVLMNNANFSASDIFLSGFKGRQNVLLMGTASSGGSARRMEHVLPNSGLAVSLATLASFEARSSTLYDGVGIQPDLEFASEPGFFVNASDDVLDQAISLIRSFGGNWF